MDKPRSRRAATLTTAVRMRFRHHTARERAWRARNFKSINIQGRIVLRLESYAMRHMSMISTIGAAALGIAVGYLTHDAGLPARGENVVPASSVPKGKRPVATASDPN